MGQWNNKAMKLYINSIKNNSAEIEVKLIEQERAIIEKSKKAQYQQSENLLPLIKKVLSESGRETWDIKEIEVENEGGTFTSVRIGIVIANALGYAWGVPVKGTASQSQEKRINGFSVAQPVYNKEPNITI